MEIILAEHAGFCFGVKRAIDTAERAANSASENRIYTFGPIIHNPQAVDHLRSKGVHNIDSFENLEASTILIRSHGVPPEVVMMAKEKGLNVIDATCPFVRKAQLYAKQLKDEGYQVVVVGENEHPEVVGIVGYTENTALVVSKGSELVNIKVARLGIVAQTTQSIENFKEVVSTALAIAKEVKSFNTICTATTDRQNALRDLARRVELVLVVGGRNSANTRRLAEICQEEGIRCYLVEIAAELKREWFKGVSKVGVTAGASTPDWIIEEVLQRMEEFKAGTATNETESMDDFAKEYDKTFKVYQEGDIVQGIVERIERDQVLVSLEGYKADGVIPLIELSIFPVSSPNEVVNVGDKIEVYILRRVDDSKNHEGILLLSKRRCDLEKGWKDVVNAFEEKKTIMAKIINKVEKGLVADIGVRGFIPASQISRRRVNDLSVYVGKTIPVRIIELERERNKVILSSRVIEEENYAKQKNETWESISEGQIRKGTVRRLTAFGAFVDIGGAEGLLHISDMSWHRVSNPSEVVKENDEINVVVLKIDRENEKISLGLKQTIPNPWDNIEEKYQVGYVVKGKVVRTAKFGAFVELEPGVDGLVHISQLSDKRVNSADDVVKIGDEVMVKVIDLDKEHKKIGLSIKEALVEKDKEEYRAYIINAEDDKAEDSVEAEITD